MGRLNKKHIWMIIIPILLWLLNFIYGNQFFSTINVKIYVVLKVILLLGLFGAEYLIAWIVKGCLKGIEAVKIFLRTFLIIFVIYMAWLIASWPGGWGNDGYVVLGLTKKCAIGYWTSLLTSIEYMLAVMIFPSPNSVLVLQVILCALIIARIIYITYLITENKRITYYGLIPFIVPVVIIYVLSPVRAILFALFALMSSLELIYMVKLREKVSYLQLVLFSAEIACAAFWRSEGCLLILLIPFYLVVLYRTKKARKQMLTLIISSVLMIGGMKSVTISSYQYMINSLYYPIQHMIQSGELHYEGVEADLDLINKVYNVEVMRQSYSDPMGGFSQPDFAYGKEGFNPESATEEEYHAMLLGFIRMVLHKPGLFVKVRLETFWASMQSSGFWMDYVREQAISTAPNLDIDSYPLFERWNLEIQRKICGALNFTLGRKLVLSEKIFNNMFLPILLIGILFIKSLWKKDRSVTLITFIYLGMTVGTIVFEPLSQPMYYLHQYIMGYYLLIYEASNYIQKRRNFRIR